MKFKKYLLLCVVALMSGISEISAAGVSRDSIISDFDTLVKIVESTHPDPYTNYGGRVFFYKTANDCRLRLMSESSLTVNDLYEVSSEFLSYLQDGHTNINAPAVSVPDAEGDSILLVKFRYGGESLFVDAIGQKDARLLGSRLTGINGVTTDKVTERVAKYYPCENKAGKYGFMSDYFRPLGIYRKLAGREDGKIILELITPEGERVAYTPEVIHYSDFSGTAIARVSENKEFPSGQMEWKDMEGMMFFRLASVMSRENFEYQYANGWDFYQDLSYCYRLTGLDMPSDTLAAVKGVPSFSDTFMDMLTEMKSRDIKNLVIDLRGNGGGWTPVVLPSLYMMYGDAYLDTDMSGSFFRRVSQLYLDKVNTTIDEFNEVNGTALNIGDYIFPESGRDIRTKEQKREDFLRTAFCSEEIKEKLRRLDGKPLYRPDKVFVVTDHGTFSAAFHYAFYLSRLGAYVAGETSSQSPNCYMETTPFILPNTGLAGSVSNSMQIFLPSDDIRAKVFLPDTRLKYEDYRRYGFDRNSILLELLHMTKAAD